MQCKLIHSFLALTLAFLALTLASAPVAAQIASSDQHYLAGSELGSGGTAQTSQFVLTGTLGPAPASESAFSGNYELQGGFCAGLDVVVPGKPWLTAVTPRFCTMNGASPITVHGTELNFGGLVSCMVGGVAATVQSRNNAQMITTLPPQPAPGWQSAEVTTTAGTAVLAKAVGVLPMIEAVDPLLVNHVGALLYRGRQGDQMIWLYSLSLSPVRIPVSPLHHGLELGLTSLYLTDAFGVSDPTGELRLPVPPILVAIPIYIQALALSGDPGYAPGSFTNTIRLF